MVAANTIALKLISESRTDSRVKLTVPFLIRHEKSQPFESESVISENISKKGLCIITNSIIPIHTKIYLETPNRRFRALAIVVYSTENRAGLKILASKGTWLVQ
jgi:hypothetical protein